MNKSTIITYECLWIRCESDSQFLTTALSHNKPNGYYGFCIFLILYLKFHAIYGIVPYISIKCKKCYVTEFCQSLFGMEKATRKG